MPPIGAVLKKNLTKSQFEAASDPAKEVLCLACAGSGKSRTLAYRIVRLIAGGTPPAGIVAFTFTDMAAESIKRQVAKALTSVGMSPTVVGAMFIGTIHSYCQYLLAEADAKYRQFDVLDENRLKLFLISRYPQLGISALRAKPKKNDYFEKIEQVADAWATMNDELVDVAAVRALNADLGNTLGALGDLLEREQFIDFSLMIRLAVGKMKGRDPATLRALEPVQHLMVDEYQDVNPGQEALIREIHGLSDTLFVVGDDDQSIYGWRGADVGNILTFKTRYPSASEHTLAVNFRSTEPIVASADGFVAAELGATRMAKAPTAKATKAPRDFRVLWFPARADEAEWVAERIGALMGSAYEEQDGSIRGLTPGDFAILMRSTRGKEQDGGHRHSAFTAAMDARGIGYTLEAGGSVFDRPQVSALRDSFGILRAGSPTRAEAKSHFDSVVLPAFPDADFTLFANVLAEWGRQIHPPHASSGAAAGTAARLRVYPQQLVHDLLSAFRIHLSAFGDEVMQDIGLFSRMIQDVEAVYMSVDSTRRFTEILNFLGNVAEKGYDTGTDHVMQRPDVVTVSTVHKMKGLEFPVVFLVDAEAQRFPMAPEGYKGLLPESLISGSVSRGVYRNTREGEARLFFTALTRSERYLYVSGSEMLPGGKKRRKQSPFSLRLSHAEISTVPAGLPSGLVATAPRRRFDETVVPTSYSEIRYYLKCPRDYKFRNAYSFSPAIKELFGYGRTVHATICKLHELFTAAPPTQAEAEVVAGENFYLKHVPQSKDPVAKPGPYERARGGAIDIASRYARDYTSDFGRSRQVEVRFEIPVRQAVISGDIDLLLREDPSGAIESAEVVDFKAMEDSADLEWTDLALQVQLYAKAAKDVLGDNAKTGSVHLLKDGKRVDVPVADVAIGAAVANVEWAVDRILNGDFPMRPHPKKCEGCDFNALCAQTPEDFRTATRPPAIHVPGPTAGGPAVTNPALAFSEYDPRHARI
jgi:DNA helicase-2/ATP-dependent DNA helicase PcrA